LNEWSKQLETAAKNDAELSKFGVTVTDTKTFSEGIKDS